MSFQSILTTWVVQWRQRNPSKSALHVKSFCFAYLLVSVVNVVELSSASNVTMQNNSWHATISTEKLTIWWKSRVEIVVRGYPYWGAKKGFFRGVLNRGKMASERESPLATPSSPPVKANEESVCFPKTVPWCILTKHRPSSTCNIQLEFLEFFFMESRNPDYPEKKGGKEQ